MENLAIPHLDNTSVSNVLPLGVEDIVVAFDKVQSYRNKGGYDVLDEEKEDLPREDLIDVVKNCRQIFLELQKPHYIDNEMWDQVLDQSYDLAEVLVEVIQHAKTLDNNDRELLEAMIMNDFKVIAEKLEEKKKNKKKHDVYKPIVYAHKTSQEVLAQSYPGYDTIPSDAKSFRDVFLECSAEMPDESFCFLNEQALRERVQILQENFVRGLDYRKMAYAVKANPKKRVLEILGSEGVDHFDCASPNEIELIEQCIPGSKILYNHPIKTRTEIYRALKNQGVSHYTADHVSELEKIYEIAYPMDSEKQVEIAVRVDTPNNESSIDLSSKFGASKKEALEMIANIQRQNGFVPGISMHVGSQSDNPEYFVRGIDYIANIARMAGGVQTFNIGGGLPANYSESDNFIVKHFLDHIHNALLRASDVLNPDGSMFMEPGRGVVAESVDLVVPVVSRKNKRGEDVIYIQDGVFNCFSDSAIHNWQYNFNVLTPRAEVRGGAKKEFKVFGRTCDSGDVIKNVCLPESVQPGDYLHVKSAGAYMDSQSTKFNGCEPPTYISYNI